MFDFLKKSHAIKFLCSACLLCSLGSFAKNAEGTKTVALPTQFGTEVNQICLDNVSIDRTGKITGVLKLIGEIILTNYIYKNTTYNYLDDAIKSYVQDQYAPTPAYLNGIQYTYNPESETWIPDQTTSIPSLSHFDFLSSWRDQLERNINEFNLPQEIQPTQNEGTSSNDYIYKNTTYNHLDDAIKSYVQDQYAPTPAYLNGIQYTYNPENETWIPDQTTSIPSLSHFDFLSSWRDQLNRNMNEFNLPQEITRTTIKQLIYNDLPAINYDDAVIAVFLKNVNSWVAASNPIHLSSLNIPYYLQNIPLYKISHPFDIINKNDTPLFDSKPGKYSVMGVVISKGENSVLSGPVLETTSESP